MLQSSFDGTMRAVGDWREVESTTYNTTYWFNNKTGEVRERESSASQHTL